MDYKKKWNHDETRRKYADILIDVGSKFYFAAFTLPLAYYIKQDKIDLSFFIFAVIALLILGFVGTSLQKHGLKIYDNNKPKHPKT